MTPTIDQAWIQNKIMEYVINQKKVLTSSLYNQFDMYPSDLVVNALNELIDTNALITKIDERGREYLYLGPNR